MNFFEKIFGKKKPVTEPVKPVEQPKRTPISNIGDKYKTATSSNRTTRESYSRSHSNDDLDITNPLSPFWIGNSSNESSHTIHDSHKSHSWDDSPSHNHSSSHDYSSSHDHSSSYSSDSTSYDSGSSDSGSSD